ncbi:MAG: NB-ARC domain-containing protein [Elainellaceae cyanobacterium]
MKSSPSPEQKRLKLMRFLSGAPVQQLNAVIAVVKPPAGIIPPPSAPPGDRTTALMDWAEGSTGPGLDHLETVVREILGIQSEQPAYSLGKISPTVPKLPPHFLPRENELAGIKAKVLSGTNQSVAVTGTRKASSIQGMGGIGKSVLACAVARDDEIQRAFPDGVFWVSLGQTPNLLQLQTELAQDLTKAFDCDPPGFGDVNGGKRYLCEQLAPRRCFVVLDDVWQFEYLKAFDVVGDGSQLLITTRDSTLVTSFGAEEHSLELLSSDQALVLLADWTDRTVESLPDDAADVARECGYLPLALSMAGAMLKGKPDNRWSSVLKRLQNADLDKIKQQFPDYPYPDLLKTLQVSVDALEPEQRERYLDFAVFPEDTSIPEAVVQILWAIEGLDDLDTEELLDELVAKSLMRRDDEGRLTLHDLQYDYITQQIDDMPGLHQRLLDAYENVADDGWATVPADGYFYSQAARHFMEAGRQEELKTLLLDYDWLAKKLAVTGINSLIADYDWLPDEPELSLVQKTLRLSAHVLSRQPDQLTERLWGHLCGREQPAIQKLLNQGSSQKQNCWLKPIRANLTVPDGSLLRTLEGHSAGVVSVAISSDGLRALSGSENGTVKVWDVASGTVFRTLKGHSVWVWSVAISADGSCALSGSYDRTVKVWDVASRTVLHTLEGHSARITSVAISADGSRAISGSEDRTAKVWDVTNGTVLHTLENHSDTVWSVAISADGKVALSLSMFSTHTVNVWDVASGAILHTLENRSAEVTSVTISADGSHVLSGSYDGTVKVWDVASGAVLHTLKGHSDAVGFVAISADGSRALSRANDGTVKMWDITNGVALYTLKSDDKAEVWAVAISIDCSASSEEFGSRVISGSHDRTVKVWDMTSKAALLTPEGHSSTVCSVSISADGSRAISGSNDSTIKVWDVTSGAVLRTLESHRDAVVSVSISADGSRAISGSNDSTIKVWDVTSGAVLRTLESHRDAVASVSISADGSRAISGSNDDTIKVWNVTSRATPHTLESHSNGVCSVAISADGLRAISGSNDGTKVWDVTGKAELHTLVSRALVSSVAISADGAHALSGLFDGTVTVWDVTSEVEMHILKGHGNNSLLWSVAISADGSRALSGSDDRTVKMWDLNTGECLATFCGDSPFNGCAISPDGTTVVAGDQAGMVHFFEIVEPE